MKVERSRTASASMAGRCSSEAVDTIYPVLEAALAGFGLAYMPEELAQPHLESGRLLPVLKDGCPTFPGLHIFYASKRQSSLVLSLIVEILRYRKAAW